MSEFVRYSHSVGNNIHHLQWCTKMRYKMFRKLKYKAICTHVIRNVAERHNIKILELAVQDDHVHTIAQLPPMMSQSQAMQLLKGGSAFEMFRLAPKFRLRYPRGSLWSRGNFKDSVGRIDVNTARNYVRNQDEVHKNLFAYS